MTTDPMIYSHLNNGAQMPSLGLGTWLLDDSATEKIVKLGIDLGYRHIDTAAIYGNEVGVGKGIADAKISRDELFITTKIWTTNFTAEKLPDAADESLEKLQLDYVDLLLLHWPNKDVPLAETIAAMGAVAEAGKAKAIGVSNFTVALMKETCDLTRVPIAVNQVEYHVLLGQEKILKFADAHDISVTAYCPLAQGRLKDHPILDAIGRKHGKTAAQVALRWLVQQKNVSAIPKASSERNLRANLEVFDFALDAVDLAEIAALPKDQRVNSQAWAPRWD